MPSVEPDAQRRFAVEVVRALRDRGYEAYWAGGCVRDQLLGRVPKDYDVATSAAPDQIRQVFARRKTLSVGAAFGVMVVVGPRAAGQIDVATFREDLGYSDGRRPDGVSFSTAERDAQRRDFTINGLFFDPLAQQVLDFVGGQDDLRLARIRAIGDPEARFAEDKLRMLRGVRFAAAFDFQLEATTRGAIARMAPQVISVSAERIAAELRLMLALDTRRRAVELLLDVGLLPVILPEVRPADPAWPLALSLLAALDRPGFPLALAALAEPFLSPAQALALARRLRLSNPESGRLRWLVEHAHALNAARTQPWPPLQRVLAAAGCGDLVELATAQAQARGASADDADYCRLLRRLPAEILDPPPLLTGDDLLRHGIPPGRTYQRLLAAVRDAQLTGQVRTLDQALGLVDRLRLAEPNAP
jgi:tRNA nucleotidyltransferase/poly(A) polymerase